VQPLRAAGALAEQVVADLLAPLGRELARLARRQHGQRGVGAVVYRTLADLQHRGYLGIGLALAQQQRQRRSLVGGEVVQSAHLFRHLRRPERSGARPGRVGHF